MIIYYIFKETNTYAMKKYFGLFLFTTASLLLTVVNSCKKDSVILIPSLNTSISNVSSTTALVSGVLESDGGAGITSKGFCWNNIPNPTKENYKTTISAGTNPFSYTIADLSPATKYYVRAYAINSAGIGYGNEMSFTTQPQTPNLVTSSVTSITASTAVSGGDINNDGGAIVTFRGICWSTTQNPTVNKDKTSDGYGAGKFTSTMTGLSPYTKYYVRAYATNSAGTSYGNEVDFKTQALLLSLTTSPLSSIAATTVTCGGDITNPGGAPITSRGVCWDVNQNPTIQNSKVEERDISAGAGAFTNSITGLNPGTTYYFRAFATSIAGTSYGNQVIGTTHAVLPDVTTMEASNIAETSFRIGAAITYDGGSPVTERGLCWSKYQNPTINNGKLVEGSGVGSFARTISNASHNTTYYVRAYATNSMGTSYGNQITVKTLFNPWHPHVPVPINGITWAPVNMGFETTNFYGLLFQWGRKYGQDYNNSPLLNFPGPVSISEGNNASNANNFYHCELAPHDWCSPQVPLWSMALYNPCPSGWRVPTKEEFESLNNLGSTWDRASQYGNLYGRWYGIDHSGMRSYSVFLPAAGYKRFVNGVASLLTIRGSYWATTYTNTYSYAILFTNEESIMNTNSRANGFSVRCVRD